MERGRIEHLLGAIRNKRVLVIGDIILDKYVFGKVERISPEAPVPVVEVEREEYRLGGAGNVAGNLKALGVDVYLCGVVGNDREGELIKDFLRKEGIKDLTVKDEKRRTTLKTRIVSMSQQLIRIDREEVSYIRDDVLKTLIDYLNSYDFEYVIVSDYAKGVIVDELTSAIRNKGVMWSVDPKPKNMRFYGGATLITPNEKEVREMSGVEDVVEGAFILREELGVDTIAVTRGAKGITLVREEGFKNFPARAKQVFDVTGAGDTVIAVMSSLMLTDASWDEICTLANIAAGISVGKLGTSPVMPEEIISYAEEGEILRKSGV